MLKTGTLADAIPKREAVSMNLMSDAREPYADHAGDQRHHGSRKAHGLPPAAARKIVAYESQVYVAQ